MRFQKKLVAQALLGYQPGDVGKLILIDAVWPDARHRRPLKSFLPSKCKKATPVLVPKAEMSVKKCPTSVRCVAAPGIPRGICISHLFLRKRQNEVLEKMLERH